MVTRVGLTGGIGSGKSTVSALLSERGAVVIDYDVLARRVVEPGQPALGKIGARFGTIAADGTLDRPALGAIVFADETARRELEAITHPAIRDLAASLESQAKPDATVIHDNPLLIEMGASARCDEVIVVDVSPAVQLERLIGARGMSEPDARARIAAQASREDRLAAATIVIDNDGSRDELAARVNEVWNRLVGE